MGVGSSNEEIQSLASKFPCKSDKLPWFLSRPAYRGQTEIYIAVESSGGEFQEEAVYVKKELPLLGW